MSQNKFSCFPISEGVAEGEILISNDPINFYIVEPDSGKVIEKGHSLENMSIADKILVFPSDKGSSVVQMDGLYQMSRFNNMPKGIIVRYPSTVLVSSTIIMNIPMVSEVEEGFYERIKNGDNVVLDANNGTVTLK
ncbi:DUF126 domain-containing protein [Synergistaceae bacterium OttesenSCG-928-I11]|nr:DUF126 domain-containing protein [Synergistaceae bacterium OttesenSCG-928-I11]